MASLPMVVRAEYRGGFRIRLTFNDGSEKTVDFEQWLHGPVFEPVRDPDCFKGYVQVAATDARLGSNASSRHGRRT